jgi:hypothetical protein
MLKTILTWVGIGLVLSFLLGLTLSAHGPGSASDHALYALSLSIRFFAALLSFAALVALISIPFRLDHRESKRNE